MSAAMTLHGSPMSTCTKRVLVCLKEMGVDIPFKAVTGPAQIKSAEWLEKQPFGQMPYLEEDNFVVFESRAIAKYLALKPIYALFEQACSIEMTNFEANVYGLAWELKYKKMFKIGEPDIAKVDNLKATLASRLEGYERILSKNKYLAGDQLTLADLYHLPHGTLASSLGAAPGLTDGSLTNVTRWWSSLISLESWKSIN